MRILVFGDDSQDLTTIENAFRSGRVEFLKSGEPTTEVPRERLYTFAGRTLDSATRDLVGVSERRIALTSSEFDLLIAFVRRPGQALSRSSLTTALRGRAWTYFDRSLDTLVARLRKKIDAEGHPSLIRSVRGVGYVFCASVTSAPCAARADAA